MSSAHILIYSSGSQAEQNNLDNFGIRHYEEYLCEITLNSDQSFRKRCCWKIFLIYNSGGHLVWRNGINKRHYMYEKQFCERIFDLDLWFSRRYRLKIFLSRVLAIILFGGAKPFMFRRFCNRALWEIFVWN